MKTSDPLWLPIQVKRLAWLSVAAIAVLAAAGAGRSREQPLKRFEFAQTHMGTRFRIVLYAPDQATAVRASSAAFDRIAKLDDTMSDYRPTSELMRLCAQGGGAPAKVSEDLFRVLAASQELARRSDGAFDATVGPVVQLWRRARRRHELPDAESLAQALELVGYRKLQLDEKARTVRLEKPGMLLDLGGIAKGYAADEALAELERQGVSRALVAAGGDIAVSKPPPRRKGWIIGVAPLESPANPPARYLLLENGAVSTSGDAEQHLDIGGVRHSHIVDPRTGRALEGRSSVTVVARRGIESDGLATAVSVLGPKRGIELVNSVPGAGVVFVRATSGGIQTYESRFPPTPPCGARRSLTSP